MSESAPFLSWSALVGFLLAGVLIGPATPCSPTCSPRARTLALRTSIDQHRHLALQQQALQLQHQSALLQQEVSQLQRQVRDQILAPQSQATLRREGLALQPWREGQADAWLIELKAGIQKGREQGLRP